MSRNRCVLGSFHVHVPVDIWKLILLVICIILLHLCICYSRCIVTEFFPVNFGLDSPSRPEIELRSRYCDCAAGWTIWGSNPGRYKRFFSSPKRPGQLWDPPSVLFNGYRGSFSQVKQPGRKLPTHLHLVSMLRISGAIPLIPLYIFMAWTGIHLLSRNTNKMHLCNRIYYSKVFWRLNMFRAAHRSSSGALNCICSLWFISPCGDRLLSRLSGKCKSLATAGHHMGI